MLKIDNINKSFDEKQVLHDLSFSVEEGEILALLGKNGAGKTTMFRIILGILEPDTGSVTYNGDKINLQNAKIFGFLPEERSLLKKFTIYQQLMFFGALKKASKEKLNTNIDYWLKRFDLFDYKFKKMKELSKGNQQKIQFISAILHDPKVVILDEPFSGLDPFNIELFRDVILELKAQNKVIILSSHRLDYIESFSKRIIVLIDGKDKINGNIDELKREANEFTIKIVGSFDYQKLENLEHVLSITTQENGTFISIDDYSIVKTIFQLIKDGDIEEFKVDLLTLEEVLKRQGGGIHSEIL